MHTFKISLDHHIKHLWVSVYYALVIIGASFLNSYSRYGFIDYAEIFIVATIVFLLFFIPQLVLHIDYYIKNKGDILFYDSIGQRITISHKGEAVSFLFEDIELIKQFKSYPLAEDRMHWFPWDGYNYSVIRLKGGQEFIVTSLLVPNMDLPIESKKMVLKKTFYAMTDT